jgi:ABC-type transport system involved in multi-copper enzyme maturation permease subunit
MNGIIALFIDAYRELNARKLFWLTLALSLLLVLAFGSIGFNERGLSLLYGLYEVDSPYFVKGNPLSLILYQGIFSYFMVTIWLAWGATILALISTTSIFPDFLASGSVELVLSKPIRRITLFIVKYIGALLFVLFQVTVFCVGAFICIGLRIGTWDPTVLLGIPLITLFFSYLYCINVLVGIISRSAMAALLVCLIFWFLLFSLQQASELVAFAYTDMALGTESQQRAIDNKGKELEATEQRLAAADNSDRQTLENQRDSLDDQISRYKTEMEDQQETLGTLGAWKAGVDTALWFLPKTGATKRLLTRALEGDAPVTFTDLMTGNFDSSSRRNSTPDVERETTLRIEAEERSVPAWWILGTSVAFELVILTFAAFVFIRRDY